MSERAVIILAAGEGTRMKSPLPKVLHPVNGRPLVTHVLDAAHALGLGRPVVVVGYGRDQVRTAIEETAHECEFVIQPVQKGTADAVCRAMDVLRDFHGTLVVLSGDVPLLTSETLSALLLEHEREGRGVTLLTAALDDPSGYGRIVRDASGRVDAIVEEKDASDRIRKIREINSGTYGFDADALRDVLDSIDSVNRQQEFYLTDAVRLMRERGLSVGAVMAPEAGEILGVNTPEDLERVRRLYRAREKQRTGN